VLFVELYNIVLLNSYDRQASAGGIIQGSIPSTVFCMPGFVESHLFCISKDACSCVADYLNDIEAIRSQVIHPTFDNTQSSDFTSPAPVLVHCSAGVGRTGVLILTQIMKALLEHNQVLLYVFRFVVWSNL
jgi:Protein-tyrosine phosphatase